MLTGPDEDPFPPLDGMDGMADALADLGFAAAGFSGAAAFSWTEIAAWASLTGARLSPWEASTLRAASAAYAAQLSISHHANVPPPWEHPVARAERLKAQASDRLERIRAKRKSQGAA